MWRIHVILITLLFSSKAAAFDVLNISTITDHNGLSQNTIRCMMQDSRGFMWMGTINGLNRYNGKEFMVVQPLPIYNGWNLQTRTKPVFLPVSHEKESTLPAYYQYDGHGNILYLPISIHLHLMPPSIE